MYRDKRSVQKFLTEIKERLPGPIYTYLLTIDFAKHDTKAYLERFYTLKNALDYIFKRDPNAVILAHEELYEDGKGYHIHAIIITSRRIYFKEFLKYAKNHALIYANFNIKYAYPNAENILRVTSYVVKNKKEVYNTWRLIKNK